MKLRSEGSLKSAYVSIAFLYNLRGLTSRSDRIAGATSEINALKEAFNRGMLHLISFIIGPELTYTCRRVPDHELDRCLCTM